MQKTKRKRWLFGVLSLAVMALIFAFSMENGAQSSDTSGRVVRVLLALLYPGYDALPAAEQETLFSLGQTVVRKGAHFSIYACLGFCLMMFWKTFAVRSRALLAFLCTVGYACTDEVHQLFVDNRSGSFKDVLLDSAGAVAGILLARGVLHVYNKKRELRRSGGNKR